MKLRPAHVRHGGERQVQAVLRLLAGAARVPQHAHDAVVFPADGDLAAHDVHHAEDLERELFIHQRDARALFKLLRVKKAAPLQIAGVELEVPLPTAVSAPEAASPPSAVTVTCGA